MTISLCCHGTLSFHSDGSFVYTPDVNSVGLITFTYQISDGALLSNVATVEILVQPQRAGDAARDARRLERVSEPRAEMVALGIDEDLRLVPQPPECLGVDDAVAVALERRPQPALVLREVAPARRVGADGERRQPSFLVLTHEPFEGVSSATGELRHQELRVVGDPDSG